MICPSCGGEVPEKAVYCVKCGCKLTDLPADCTGPSANSELSRSADFSGNAEKSDSNSHAGGKAYVEIDEKTVKKPKITFKKALPFLIGGVLVIAFAVFCCAKFAASGIAYSLMGEEKYTASLVRKTLDGIIGNEYFDSYVISQITSSVPTDYKKLLEDYEKWSKDNPDSSIGFFEYVEMQSAGRFLSKLGQRISENGMYLKAGVKAEVTDGFYSLLEKEAGLDPSEAKKAAEDLNGLNGEVRFSVNEDGLNLGYLISHKEEKLDGGSVFFNAKEGNLYLLNPDIYGSALRLGLCPAEIDAAKKESGFDPSYMARGKKLFINEIAEIYSRYVKKSETEFKDTVEDMGGSRFRGKAMSVIFRDEILVDMLIEMTEAFYDSDYFKCLLDRAVTDSGSDIDPNELRDNAKASVYALMSGNKRISLAAELLVKSDNTAAGFNLEAVTIDGEDKYSTQTKFIDTRSNFFADCKVNGTSLFKCTGVKYGLNSGFADIIIFPRYLDEGRDAMILSLEYSDISQKKIMGETRLLGEVKIKIRGSFLEGSDDNEGDSGIKIRSAVKDTEFILAARAEKEGIEYTLEANSESCGRISLTLQLGENSEPVSDRAGMTAESSVEVNIGTDEAIDAEIAILKHIRELCEKNSLINGYFSYIGGGDAEADLGVRIEDLESSRRFLTVYKDYDGYHTVYTANKTAYNIMHCLSSKQPLNLKSGEPVTVKLYYDGKGQMNVVDSAGVDISLLDNISEMGLYKNTYVEIIYCPALNQWAPAGVTAVMTDRRDHGCTELPTVYNYVDGVYPWEGELNYIGNYVVGTYPNLDTGDSTYEEKIKELSAEVDMYNEYAKICFEAFNGFLEETGNALNFPDYYKTVTNNVEIEIKSGEWSEKIYSVVNNFKNSIKKEELYNYLKTHVPEIKDGYLTLYIFDNKVMGTSFSNIKNRLCTSAYISGVISDWGMIEGITRSEYITNYINNRNETPQDYAIGTYPVIKSFNGSLSEEAAKLITGTWISNEDEDTVITVTEEDLSHITEIKTSIQSLEILFDYGGGQLREMRFNLIGEMTASYIRFHKK